MTTRVKQQPGQVRDAIIECLEAVPDGARVKDICIWVREACGGNVASSSVRSYLRLNTPSLFSRIERGRYRIRRKVTEAVTQRAGEVERHEPKFTIGNAQYFHADCFDWFASREPDSIHAVVTDPPYGLVEYDRDQLHKRRLGNGGVWRIPPSFDGVQRAPLPRFTTLNGQDLDRLREFFFDLGNALMRVLVPGAHVFLASNPLVSHLVACSLGQSGLERRGEIIRLVQTLRGGDRPKNAHDEFAQVTVMPRSMWEPWLLFRKPLDGRVQDNLRKWGTGGLRRESEERPFGDVIQSTPTRKDERELAPHPSLKPQKFLRRVVRAALPLERGVVLDPFAGSGSTLAAAEYCGYESIGVETSSEFADMARHAIPRLAVFKIGEGRSRSRENGTS